MSVLTVDGFDHYGTDAEGSAAMLTAFYTEVPESVYPTNLIGPDTPPWGARAGAFALGTGGGVGGDCYRFPLPSSQTSVIVSCGFSVSNLPSVDSDQGIVSFRDGSNQVLAELWLTTTGAIELRGPYTISPFTPGFVISSTVASVINPEVWHFLEMQIDTSSRSFTLRVDDATGTGTPAISVISQTFGRTAGGTIVANAPVVSFALLQRSPTGAPSVKSAWLDDLVVKNTAGLTNNSFSGTSFVGTSYPISTLIPPTGVSGVTSFSHTDLPWDMTRIDATASVILANKTGAGAATLKQSLVGPLKNIIDGGVITLSSTPSYYTTIFETNPDGGVITPLTIADGAIKLTPTTADTAPTFSQLVELTIYHTGLRAQIRQWSWSFTLDGHTFYVLDLGEEGTFAYDVITHQWCKLSTQGFNGQWNFANGTMWGDRVVAGDLTYNITWELDPNSADDEGWRPINHIVTGGIPFRNNTYVGCALFHLVGSSGQTQSVTPNTLTLNFSDDNGKTWSPDFTTEIARDATDFNIQWPALGSFTSPGRIFKLTDQGGLLRLDGADAYLTNYQPMINNEDG